MDDKKPSFKYTFNNQGIIAYYAWLMFNVLLISVKRLSFVQEHLHKVFSHTSNFVITAILMSTISLIWILQGAPYRMVLWLGMVAILLNFIVELFIPVLNTPDVVDAIYGTAGTVITALVMYYVKTQGLQDRSE